MADPKIIQFPLGLTENIQYNYTGKINIPTADILAFNSVAQTLVAAPGAGYVLMPIHAIVKLNFGTIVYATNINVGIVHDGLTTQLIGINAVINQASDWIRLTSLTGGAYASATAENKALDIMCATGDPTGGDGSIDVYLWYINLEL